MGLRIESAAICAQIHQGALIVEPTSEDGVFIESLDTRTMNRDSERPMQAVISEFLEPQLRHRWSTDGIGCRSIRARLMLPSQPSKDKRSAPV